ncbi:MAG: hypothetical protein IEMM0008_1669 [bacterium]|nr:MAG: hypothetical protein IEMM0008_1669 [bacterium]
MQTIRQILRVPKNHELMIKIPDKIPENEEVEVILILKDNTETRKQKLGELKKAMSDPLFLQDLKEVSGDFQSIDLEGW